MLRLPATDRHNIVGFALENALGDEQVAIEVRGIALSDDPRFYTYLKHVSGIFLHPNQIQVDHITRLVIVIHDDTSSDIYVNDEITIHLEIISKRPIEAGQTIAVSDVADIRKLQLASVSLAATDKVAVCLKVGWKFGFFFDLGRSRPLDVAAMERDLGRIQRRLTFEHVYRAIESQTLSTRLFEDGWFPFVELLGSEYDTLAQAYQADFAIDGTVDKLLSEFNVGRISVIVGRWWSNPVFAEHQSILEAGIESFNQNTPSGDIGCIKTLGTEIEGILRRKAAADTGGTKGKVTAWIRHLSGVASAKAGIDDSLLLPEMFRQHIERRIFRNFEVDDAGRLIDQNVSRHSVSHGAAAPEAYTRARALQMILILDQIFFYAA